ncbi:integrase core domain-containing protein [Kitasatospora purpeofusca]|uniref:Transposase n=1 Tax=Kitasatospora purpeofusca TaxID=67352 RepID=A0ABZ1TZU1_9ACTN|nr:integrase core domain-containing protein [Kitasatospora purpeofusca]
MNTTFDAVFTALGARVVPILPGLPRMNAIAERRVGSCRREATDRVLITGERHLRLVIDEYGAHHNEHRPHRSLGQRRPDGVGKPEPPAADDQSRVIRRDRLGGLIHECAQVAQGDTAFGTRSRQHAPGDLVAVGSGVGGESAYAATTISSTHKAGPSTLDRS